MSYKEKDTNTSYVVTKRRIKSKKKDNTVIGKQGYSESKARIHSQREYQIDLMNIIIYEITTILHAALLQEYIHMSTEYAHFYFYDPVK